MYRRISGALAERERLCAGAAGVRVEPDCERGLVCRVRGSRENSRGGEQALGVASEGREVG